MIKKIITHINIIALLTFAVNLYCTNLPDIVLTKERLNTKTNGKAFLHVLIEALARPDLDTAQDDYSRANIDGRWAQGLVKEMQATK